MLLRHALWGKDYKSAPRMKPQSSVLIVHGYQIKQEH